MALPAIHLLRPLPSTFPSPSSSFISFLKPLFISTPNALSTRLPPTHIPQLRKTLFTPLCNSSFSSSSLSVSQIPPPSATVRASVETLQEDDSDDEETEQFGEELEGTENEFEAERGDFEDTPVSSEVGSTSSPLAEKREERLKLEVPSLTVKERKELASYAHSLGKKLKTQLVGKSGVTSNLATSFIETLEANELLKIKIHRSCPGELDDVVKQLEEATGSVAVGQIGRTLIIYRPSLTKLKAEEKKKQVRKLFLQRQLRSRQVNKAKELPKFSRRGSSWKARNSSSGGGSRSITPF